MPNASDLEEQARLSALLRRPPWFAAQFAGSCAKCSAQYEPGFPIRAHMGTRWSDRRWVGACCAE